MNLIIKDDDYMAILVNNNEEKKIDLRYYAFEIEELKHSIYMFSNMHTIFKIDNYNNFESCIAGLSLLGGIPKFQIESSIINYGGWQNTNWYDINNHYEIKKMSKEIKKIMNTKNYFNQIFTYECNDNLDILKATIFHFLIKKGKIIKCENCNRWFMTIKRDDAKYCDRKTSNNITCKEVNVIEAKKRYKDEVIKKKEAIATYYFNNCSENLHKEFLKRFNSINKKYKNNEITKDEIMEWLENNRASKVEKEGWFEYGKTNIHKKE